MFKEVDMRNITGLLCL